MNAEQYLTELLSTTYNQLSTLKQALADGVITSNDYFVLRKDSKTFAKRVMTLNRLRSGVLGKWSREEVKHEDQWNDRNFNRD